MKLRAPILSDTDVSGTYREWALLTELPEITQVTGVGSPHLAPQHRDRNPSYLSGKLAAARCLQQECKTVRGVLLRRLRQENHEFELE